MWSCMLLMWVKINPVDAVPSWLRWWIQLQGWSAHTRALSHLCPADTFLSWSIPSYMMQHNREHRVKNQASTCFVFFSSMIFLSFSPLKSVKMPTVRLESRNTKKSTFFTSSVVSYHKHVKLNLHFPRIHSIAVFKSSLCSLCRIRF